MALPEIIKDIEARVKDTGDKMTGTLSWDGNLASLNLRANHANYDGVISYQTSGNEAMLFTTKNAVTSFMFVNGEDIIANMSAERWTKITPGLQIKNNSVYIGSLIDNEETPAYKFYVDGTSYFNGVTAFADPIRQGTTSSDSTISAMNRFQADLFVAGNGAAPNKPSVPGFYLGRSETDENRHMDIVSGGDFAYIDFNKASVVEDFKFRILVDVKDGPVNFQWSTANATTPQLNIQGSLVVANGITGSLSGNASTASALTNITANDVADKNDVQRYVFISYSNLTTGRPAYDTGFTYQTSTGTVTAKIFKGSLSGNASTATEAGVLRTDATMKLYAQYNNEINFGGTDASSSIYIGYRATDSKPIPTQFVFGGGSGTATLTAGKMILTNDTDAEGNANNGPALIVGGTSTTQHIEIDNNEIMSKSDGTTPTTLYLNANGGLVDVGSGGITVAGASKLLTLTITSTSATSHLKFSRASANYITAPTGGYVAFVPDGQGVSLAASDLTIANNQVYPGTNNVTSLGTESYRWSNIYANSLIAISGTTSATMDYTSTNPRIVFSETGTQPVGVVYTDYDSYRSPAGLKVLDMSGSNAKAWFEVEGDVYASTFQGPHNGTMLGVTETAPTAATVYSPLFINTDGNAAATTTKYTRRTNKDYRLTVLEGTASANGYIILTLGNSTATGTAGNKYGILRLYSSASNYINLRAQDIASNYTVYLPKYAGTMYLIHGGSNSAIGSKSQPVYIAANGRATACATPASGAWFNAVPTIGSDGVMEIGRYIDFHYTTGSTNDFDVRIDCAGTSANTLYLPAVTGQVVVHTNDTVQGSATLPVYVSASGLITPCTASSVFSQLSWTAGAASGPVLNVTVAGQARTATIPPASASASGIVTTGAQTFAGNKTFANNIYMTSTSAELHMKYDGTSYPILDNYNNGNITINTCGKGLYLGYSNTTAIYFGASGGWGHITSAGIYGAVWNDYAEYRNQFEEIEPGYCVASANNGKVYKTNKRMQACDGIVSDTAGFYIGQTEESQTPLAVAGRVLACCEGSKYDYQAGDTVCAGPEGKVCKMTREEIREWPDRIVGIVSEIPEYEIWGSGNVLVNGRIWIKIK